MSVTTTLLHRKPRTGTLSTKSKSNYDKQHDTQKTSESLETKKKHEHEHSRPHYKPIHTQDAVSILSPDINKLPSFSGFQNLAMIVLVVGNFRLIIENYQNYGFLKTILTLGLSRKDALLATSLTMTVPLHLFVALFIEKMASHTMNTKEKKLKHLWRAIALLHSINVVFTFFITSYVVFYHLYNPLIGTICECHAVVVCLKVASYALTNRDLRDSAIDKSPVPELYNTCAYPKNLTWSNLAYFWWAPTLVYQPVYPRSDKIRKSFIAGRVFEMALTSILIWFLTSQYATPILEKSLVYFQQKSFSKIAERLMKLSTVSIIIWLSGFFLLFQSYLNLLAELLKFADREFYQDFWNCQSVGQYWKQWNKPIHHYFLRHVYVPLLKRGWSNTYASAGVFLISALLHEIIVGLPTHNVIGVAFVCMILQVPLVVATAPLPQMGPAGRTAGNCVFWLSFFLGQPLAVLMYYFAWNLKYGSLARE